MNKKRDLLKLLSVAGATGAVWKQPVVSSTILPAHASRSLRCPIDSDADATAVCGCEGAPSLELFLECMASFGLDGSPDCPVIPFVCL